MTEKRLEDYTLGEVHELCKNRSCATCPVGPCLGCFNKIRPRPYAWTFPRLTHTEMELLRLTGAKWVSRDEEADGGFVYLWCEKPICKESGVRNYYGDGNDEIGTLNADLFPSIRPGDCLNVEELLGEGTGDG